MLALALRPVWLDGGVTGMGEHGLVGNIALTYDERSGYVSYWLAAKLPVF
jgi:hypothetical protein